jgi:DnaJ-class molecular chaperone
MGAEGGEMIPAKVELCIRCKGRKYIINNPRGAERCPQCNGIGITDWEYAEEPEYKIFKEQP